MTQEHKFYAKLCLIQGGALVMFGIISRPFTLANANIMMIAFGLWSIYCGWKAFK